MPIDDRSNLAPLLRADDPAPYTVLNENGTAAALVVCDHASRAFPGVLDRLGLPESKVVINLERFGNTTAATIPLALADAVAEKRVKKGDLVLLTSVGAGFTVGAVVLRWSL